MAKFRAATELAAAAEVAEGERPAELRRRVRALEARCRQLEDGVRRALVAHAQGNEACVCPLCRHLRALLLGTEGEPTEDNERAPDRRARYL
jgi:hypothetical protein